MKRRELLKGMAAISASPILTTYALEENFMFSEHDALIIVDVQNDFLPGGSLGVVDGNAVIPIINSCIEMASADQLPMYATRDWHPIDHCSFVENGGTWPTHCVAGSTGAEFSKELKLPNNIEIVDKGTNRDKEAYSGFQGTDLSERLNKKRVNRVIVGGIATDYCVLNTVNDALDNNFEVILLTQAIRAVNLNPDDGEKAIKSMVNKGAKIYDGLFL
jgi:nicotinamidase/pyrazinamidase